jgi:hypothetical protein
MVSGRWDRPEIVDSLFRLSETVSSSSCEVLFAGRNRTVRWVLPSGERLVVKSFGRSSPLREWGETWGRGGKARRTWMAARYLYGKGVGTPEPVAFIERCTGGRRVESYFVSVDASPLVCFRDELIRLFRENPSCGPLMDLLQKVADAVRGLHDAGFIHNDLGNQNIVFPAGGSNGRVLFLDLNRGRIRRPVSTCQRARDLSRIHLPSDLLRVFLEMYFAPGLPSRAFQRWERFFRRVYAVHAATRRFRHPFREARVRKTQDPATVYPDPRDMWVWDDRSEQPINVYRSRDRNRMGPPGRHASVAWAGVAGFASVWGPYRRLMQGAFGKAVDLRQTIGMGLSPRPDTFERERALLADLGPIPVLVRIGAHQSDPHRAFLCACVRTLQEAGFPVSVALMQDRRSVQDPARWRQFLNQTLAGVAGAVQWVEIGHAINRVKWGIWSLDEYAGLMKVTAEVLTAYPGLRVTGPAGIDFEYPFVMAALKRVPPSLHFMALSHHLYVDRRGAPENEQGLFATLEKCALARAIACASPVCDDRLIVSEVNWPLKGTGVYSPVNSPYDTPGPRRNDPSVTEDEYGHYLLRYLALSLCSGLVHSVYWWGLRARGFGLVDDADPANWRIRPAYRMLRHLLKGVGQSTFERRIELKGVNSEWTWALVFRRDGGERVCMAWSSHGRIPVTFPFRGGRVEDACGEILSDAAGDGWVLGGSPVYIGMEDEKDGGR